MTGQTLNQAKSVEISFDAFYEVYRPLPNPFDSNVGGNGCMLETYGEELEHVKAILAASPDRVWTVLDCEDEIVVSNGFHYVNRLNYLITEVPAPANTFVTVIDRDDEEN